MFFYGVLAVLFCIPWYFTRPAPDNSRLSPEESKTVSMRQALTHIMKLKNIWLLGITVMGISGCIQGLSGYLSLYLRGLGWAAPNADGALSLLSAMSMIFILPIALWSDRLGARKKIVLGMALMIAVGTGLLSFANGLLVWGAIILVGIVRDGSTALLVTMTIETDGVGPVYAGTASGFVMFFMFIGNFLSPPIGNKLADIFPGLPFVFWAGLAVIGIVSLSFVKPSQSVEQPQGVPTTTER
jgi:cyanate permease